MSWFGWIIAYLFIGLCVGEAALYGSRQTHKKLNGVAYTIGVALWPVALLIVIVSWIVKLFERRI